MPKKHAPGRIEEVPENVVALAELSPVPTTNSLPQPPNVSSSQSPHSPYDASFSVSATSDNPEGEDGFLDFDMDDTPDPHRSDNTSVAEDVSPNLDTDNKSTSHTTTSSPNINGGTRAPVEETNDNTKHWKVAVPRAFLDARKDNLYFEQSLTHDKGARASKIKEMRKKPGSPLSAKPNLQQVPQVLQKYFLRLQDISRDEPYFGFDTFPDVAGAPKLDENIPDELSARLYPIRLGSHEKVTTTQTKSTDSNGAGTNSQTSPTTSSASSASHAANTDTPAMGAYSQATITDRQATSAESRPASINSQASSTDRQPGNRVLQLVADFPSATADQYALYLEVKQCGKMSTTARLAVRVTVRYADTHTSEVFLTKFIKSQQDVCKTWQHLKAEGHFEVRPHKGIAHINVRIVQDDPQNEESQGDILVRSLALAPVKMRYKETVTPRLNDPSKPWCSLDASWSGEAGDAVVTRLAASDDGKFVAALVASKNRIDIRVWRWKNKEFSRHACKLIDEELDLSRTSIEIAISAKGDKIAVFQVPTTGDWDDEEAKLGVYVYHNDVAVGGELSLISVPNTIERALGFATFVDEFTAGDTKFPARFVFCDKRHVHVFVLQDKCLEAQKTIPLPNKSSSSLWHTMACELLVRSIATNMFIWVEGNGRYCSTWDLTSGTAFGRIEISKAHGGDQHIATEMLVTRNQNRIALLGFDNSITIVDATTGILIGQYGLSGRTVEHIAFPSAQSQMLVARTRGEQEVKQTVLILNTSQLSVHEEVSLLPSLSRLTVLGDFGQNPWPEFSVACQPDGGVINFYSCKVPCAPAPVGRREIPETVAPDCDAPTTTTQEDFYGKEERNIILDYYSIFDTAHIHEYSDIGQTRYRATVLMRGGGTPKIVPILGTRLNLDDNRMVSQLCVESSWLLALTYSEIQQIGPDGDTYKGQAQAIINFINAYMNYTITPSRDGEGTIATTVLTHLLQKSCPTGISGEFIRAVLMDKNCQWFLRYDEEFNALAVAIKRTNFFAVRAILDYCVRRAHGTQPAYVMAVEHSFSALSTTYPDVLEHFFKKASYIRARNLVFTKAYVTSSDERWRVRGQKFISKITGGLIDPPKLDRSIVTLQLSDRKAAILDRSAKSREGSSCMVVEPRYDQKVYTIPFPRLLKQDRLYYSLAGEDLFNSPFQQVVLDYKAYQFFHERARYFR
ncbi:hypothetical protein BGZ73_004576 [Actinomortierella ambigua]|nr:hypothetical protein BGZ73_004576 [Actinomortierella ambigua]